MWVERSEADKSIVVLVIFILAETYGQVTKSVGGYFERKSTVRVLIARRFSLILIPKNLCSPVKSVRLSGNSIQPEL